MNDTTTRRSASTSGHDLAAQQVGDDDLDELSSIVQPAPSSNTLSDTHGRIIAVESSKDTTTTPSQKKAVGLHKIASPITRPLDDLAVIAPTTKRFKRSRPPKVADLSTPRAQAAPEYAKAGRKGVATQIIASGELDELSPESKREPQRLKNSQRRTKTAASNRSVEEVDVEGPDASRDVAPPQCLVSKSDPRKQALHAHASREPPHKRRKSVGPKHTISVMRIKGSTVRGITVADTARTILEKTIDQRIQRMAEKQHTSQDAAHRKELRGGINLALSFKESLEEKLLDLQDANDVLSINFKKLKVFKRDNAGLRRDILALQNGRQEVALEQDDVQADYDAEKSRIDVKNTVSSNMFDIEAAIQQGRERARRLGREDEGPHVPLPLVIEDVSRAVGSSNGGLLSSMKGFNALLEKAAAWLEGRA